MSQAVLNTQNRNGKRYSCLQQKNRTWLTGIISLLSILSTIFISVWMLLFWIKNVQPLPLSKLVITGERYYTRNDDIRQLILALGTPGTFITQDINIIQNQIKHIPWIKQVIVRKQWPDKLRIHLIEYVPIAHWNNHYMVDIDGNSFKVPVDRINKQNLPLLYGPEGNENEVLQGYQKMRQILAKNQFSLKAIVMTTCRSWQIILTNGIKLYLGRQDMIKRLARFIEIYPFLLQESQRNYKRISHIDLRYNFGAAVGWLYIPYKETKIAIGSQVQAK